tara:strand:- start:1403 stop:1879 length:477 start_codon:yes stop_codon:yes gene_type:complete
MLRGNVDTRLEKIDRGEVAATFLAMAGLNRLGLAERATTILDPEYMLPAAGQGAVGIECRTDDAHAHNLIGPLNDPVTQICVLCERNVLAALDGTCYTPIAAYANIEDERLRLRARVLRPDGSEMQETQREGVPEEAEALGTDAGAELRSRVGPDFFT